MRDRAMEARFRAALAGEPELREKPMFGGLCWMIRGNMICAARAGRAMFRLGKGNDGWALDHPGIGTVVMQGRAMPGWVWADAAMLKDATLLQRLLDGAAGFVRALPPK